MKINQIARKPGAFQQPVDEHALRRSVTQELAGTRVRAITEIAAGLFNNTYRVATDGRDYILKVAPGPEADVFYSERHLMARERTLSTRLAAASPLIPGYVSFFEVDGREAFLQPWVSGRLWHDHLQSLSPEENDRLWSQLGAFAKSMHSVVGDQFGFPKPMPLFDRGSEWLLDTVRGLTADCQRLGILHPEVTAYAALASESAHVLDEISSPRLLHGDLWPRNVIIDGEGAGIHLRAVIDAERAYWGDPISDWVLLLYGVPDSFWQGYGENLLESTPPARLALYRGMYFILNLLEGVRFGHSDQDYRAHLAAVNAALDSAEA